MAGFDLPSRAIREQIASELNLIVHVDRFRDGSRRVSHVTEVLGTEGDIITLQDIYKYNYKAMRLVATGVRPEFVDELAKATPTISNRSSPGRTFPMRSVRA